MQNIKIEYYAATLIIITFPVETILWFESGIRPDEIKEKSTSNLTSLNYILKLKQKMKLLSTILIYTLADLCKGNPCSQ